MVTPPSPPRESAADNRARRDLFRWQGVLGKLGRYPVLTAVTALLCVVIIVIAGYALYPRLSAAHHWRKAQQAIEQHDFDVAKTHLNYCLSVWPASYETHFAMARTCRRNGEFETARKHLARAEQLPLAVVAEIDLEQLMLKAQEQGVNFAGAREVEQTLEDYLRLTDDTSLRVLILEALAKGCFNTRRLREADKWLAAWVKIDQASWAPYYWRGLTLENNRQLAPAVEEYRSALERRPDHPETTVRLAECLYGLGQYKEALASFEEYQRLKPDTVPGLMGIARCRRSLGQSAVAQDAVRRVLSRAPDHPGALLLHAQLLSEQDRLREALVALRQAKAIAPYEIDITFSLAKLLRELGQTDEAARLEQEGERLTKDRRELNQILDKMIASQRDPDLRSQAGAILMRVGEESQGVRMLITALHSDPRHAPTHVLLADYFEKTGDKARAENHRRLAGLKDGSKPAVNKP